MPLHLRIFLASPDDVAEERRIAAEVIDALQRRHVFKGQVTIDVIRYDDPHAPTPVSAVETPQVSFTCYVGRPADCDLTIVILWSRLGTPLPPQITRDDGTSYASGTVWELEDARAGGRDIWLYCCTTEPTISARDPEFEAKRAALLAVDDFFEQFRNADGSLKGDVNAYAGASEFRAKLEGQLEAFVHARLQGVARDGAPPVVRAGPPQVPAAYLRWLREECATIDLLGLEAKQASLARLSQVYVPLTTPAAHTEGDATERGHAGMAGRLVDRDRPGQDLLLARLGEESLYAPGPPGCGKSTFCRWVAWLSATGSIPVHAVRAPEGFEEAYPTACDGRLPLLLPLRSFWTKAGVAPGETAWSAGQLEKALADWVDDNRPGDLTGAELRAHLDAGSVLLLLDGLDEVPELHVAAGAQAPAYPRACIVRGLAAALPRWHGTGTRVLLTSRPYGLSVDEQRTLRLPQAPIAPLAAELQELFVRRWFAVADPGGREGKADALLEHLAGRDDLAPLTESPMLLTALCVRFDEGKRLPEDQYHLYDSVVNNVLHHRYLGAARERDPVRARLAAIAYGMHTGKVMGEDRRSPEPEVAQVEVDRILQRFADANPATERGTDDVIARREDLLSRSGLLLPRDRQRAAFQHFSLQEFLAAEHLARTERDDQLEVVFRNRSGEPGWRLTLVFLWAALAFRYRTTQWTVNLLRDLGDRLGGGTVRAHSAAAVVVADCLEIALGKEFFLGDLPERFVRVCLEAIADEVHLPDRLRLGLMLGRLGDPRIADARDLSAYVDVPAGRYPYQERDTTDIKEPFLIGRYAVTNGQYRRFMEDGGYDPGKPWWSNEGRAWLAKEKPEEPESWRDRRFNGENQPVVGVSWYEAEAFCAWVGRALGREARLPREREWEAAARGPAGHEYPWGGPWEGYICASIEAELPHTAPVGLFPRSRQVDLGVEDMAGNVWEWCLDVVDDKGWRGLRGGSWLNVARLCRAAFRLRLHPSYRSNIFGFRVVVGCVRQDSPAHP